MDISLFHHDQADVYLKVQDPVSGPGFAMNVFPSNWGNRGTMAGLSLGAKQSFKVGVAFGLPSRNR